MLHSVKANESASAAKSGLTVNSNGARARVAKVCLTACNELLDDGVGWS
jgi:hypothetical protein